MISNHGYIRALHCQRDPVKSHHQEDRAQDLHPVPVFLLGSHRNAPVSGPQLSWLACMPVLPWFDGGRHFCKCLPSTIDGSTKRAQGV